MARRIWNNISVVRDLPNTGESNQQLHTQPVDSMEHLVMDTEW